MKNTEKQKNLDNIDDLQLILLTLKTYFVGVLLLEKCMFFYHRHRCGEGQTPSQKQVFYATEKLMIFVIYVPFFSWDALVSRNFKFSAVLQSHTLMLTTYLSLNTSGQQESQKSVSLCLGPCIFTSDMLLEEQFKYFLKIITNFNIKINIIDVFH